MLSLRLKKLAKRLHDEDFLQADAWCFEDINILNIEEYKFLRNEPISIRKAFSLQYVAANLPIAIRQDELIIGCPAQNSVEFGMSIPKYLTSEERQEFESFGLSEQSLFGHHPPAWETILDLGVLGLKEDIDKQIQKESEQIKVDLGKLTEWRAMLISLDALCIYANRCADAALSASFICDDTIRKKELLSIHKICSRVPLHPAETFQEAVQAYWILYTILNSGGEFLPLGRIDQYFYPFYERDLRESHITAEEAKEILGSFLVKCNEKVVLDSKLMKDHRDIGFISSSVAFVDSVTIDRVRKEIYSEHYWHDDEPEDSEHNKFFGQETNNRMMTCVVGGKNLDGSDATNPVSYLMVSLISEMKLLMPTLGVRIHCKTQPEFLREVTKVLCHGQGEPIIYNDETILSEYQRLGVPWEDIVDYSSDGCWETVIPGKTNFVYEFVLVLQCLEWTMNRGITVKSGMRDGLDTGDISSFHTFEEFYEAFYRQVCYAMEQSWGRMIHSLGLTSFVAPDPLFSALSESCRESGKDFYGEGAKYQLRMLLCSGLADTVDSLMVIKRLVYDEQRLTLEELNQILLSNWAKDERLHAYVRNRVPKFGNDEEEPDAMAVRFLADYAEKIRELRRRSEKIILIAGIGTFHIYASLGNGTSASANGRYAYDAIAPNYSPVPGMKNKGPLSMIKSAVKADLSEYMSGTPVDISINANEFIGEEGIGRLNNLIQDFCDLGGQIMTITSTSVEELEDAKIHPERHQDLRVRMGGLSAYFVQLAPEQQEKIIGRFR